MDFFARLRDDEGFRTLGLTILSALALAASFFKLFPKPVFDPAWVAIALCGLPIVYGAAKGIVTEFDVTADLLVAMALVAALAIGELFAAGEVAFIMQLGKVLEDSTAGRTRASLRKLVELAPRKARIIGPEGEREVLASELREGDRLLVRPGEALPADGLVLRGSTSIDQSLVTGESIPVDRGPGDAVYQGTLNQAGAIEVEATKVGEASSLARMIALVREAEENKAPIVRAADRWARILVPVALGGAILIWALTGDSRRAVAALVVFCPCSLVLATPTAVLAAIGNATRQGILVKSGAAVEAAARVDAFVVDKTGTLTLGKPRVEELLALGGMDERELARLAASAERYSEHPLGKAVVDYARGLGLDLAEARAFEARPGRGVSAVVEGRAVALGERAIGAEAMAGEAAAQAERLRERGKTVIPVAVDGKVLGLVSIADSPRPGARKAMEGVSRAGATRIVMLTGDAAPVAESIGREAGIGEIRASLLPEGKVEAIKELVAEGHTVAMLGDGVNDAPALAAASVGIAMGAMGSDLAIEAADIALMGDELEKLPFLLSLCRATRRRILANIAIAMCINAGAMAAAGLGALGPVGAAMVHNAGSVFVVVNSALLVGYRYEERDDA